MRIRLFPLMMAFLCVPLTSFPLSADARAGQGSSFGSRGARTWSPPPRTSLTPNWARPMERTTAPRPSAPAYSAPSFGAATPRPSFPMRHPFLTSFAGGFLGAGLFGLLSGHGLFGGFHGGSSFFGFIIQALILAFIIRFIIGLIKKRSASNPSTQSTSSSNTTEMLTANDYTAFQQLLFNVQAAWSAQDIPTLQRLATPEMVGYFNEQLSDLASRGARNVVSNVQFLRGDLSESWREGTFTYATVAIQYSMIDVTTDSFGNVIDGSRTEPQTVTELWTFLRSDGRGNWILSAIQQAH